MYGVTPKQTYRPPGDQHRKQRKMLNPVFSIAHMRNMGPYEFITGFLVVNLVFAVPMFYDITRKVTIPSTT